MNTFTLTRLLTRKRALGESRLDATQEALPLAAGEALLRIDRCALTTNNITYAAFGEAMQYWDFFPAGIEGWGQIPVWGFADVVASTVRGVEVGERYYGYYPIASHIRMRPERVTPRGFYDGAAHRKTLTSAYNQYTRCSNDPAYDAASEDYRMLVRPLFITSFMVADFLLDKACFGARQIVVSSASSKTAYGSAYCLHGRHGIRLIALTSTRNRPFVESLGCYDAVVAYEELTSIATDEPTVDLDFSGDESLRAGVHRHFGSALKYDCFIGSTQNTDFLRQLDLPGPEAKFFFAPVQIRKRNADWGYEEFNRRFNAAQSEFIRRLSAPGDPWMRLVQSRGFAAVQKLVEALHAGRSDPREGHVVVLAEPVQSAGMSMSTGFSGRIPTESALW